MKSTLISFFIALIAAFAIFLTFITPSHAELLIYNTETESYEKFHFNAAGNWKTRPIFKIPSYFQQSCRSDHSDMTFEMTFKLTVEKTGDISNVELLSATPPASEWFSYRGRLIADTKRAIAQGRFNPFITNGQSVKGIIYLPVSYACR